MESIVDKTKCVCCSVAFVKKRDYDIHVLTKKHQNKINNIPTEKCNYCDYETEKKSTLEKHLKTFHREEYNKEKPDKEWKKDCEFCNVSFTSKNAFEIHCVSKKHIENELGIDKKQCKFCDYNTSKACTLDRHFRIMHPLEYKLSKVVIEDEDDKNSNIKTPPKIKALYKTLINQEHMLKRDISAFNNRIRDLKNRRYSDDDESIKSAYYNIEKCEDKIEELKPKIEKMNKKYSELKKIKGGCQHFKTSDLIIYSDKPVVISDNEEDEIDEEEIKRQQENKKFEEDSLKKQEELKIKKEKEDEYNIEIEKLQEEYILSKGNMAIEKEVKKIEKKIRELYE